MASGSTTSSKHWTVAADGEVRLKQTLEGMGSTAPLTVFEVFKRTVDKYPKKDALKVQRGGGWKTWTWHMYYADVCAAAKSMIVLGLQPYHAVGILGFNSPEWFIADLAAIIAGGFAAGIYTTNSPEACHYVAEHSRANIIVVEDDRQLQKILAVRDRLPNLKAIVQYTGTVSSDLKKKNVYEWADFMQLGRDIPDFEVQWRIQALKPNQCATLIYTSGTTGNPKAVMISHDNMTWTAQTCINILKVVPEDELISYLPLSHVAAQMIDIHAPLATGLTVWFAQPDALKGGLVNTLREVRPTVFLGVPRVWEKMQEKMLAIGKQTTGLKKTIATWAKSIGLEGNLSLQNGRDVPWGWSIANGLVFSKIREALGLDRCRIQATAAAPITRETLEYFLSLNIPVYEIYGMSECSGPQTVSLPETYRTGSCGPSVPGTELRIMNPDKDGNGEICFRGRHVFMGYLFDEAKTREAIDDDGWLHSGDIGRVDSQGLLYITGRLKELLITAGGENVAPVPIENTVKENLPFISNCILIGDKRKFLTMLLTLRCELDDEGAPTERLSELTLHDTRKLGCNSTLVAEAILDPNIRAEIQRGIDRANHKAVSAAQRIQKWELIAGDFSIPGGELGPTLKLKRPQVVSKYAEVIERFYHGTE
ncbi:long-chain-fatty-acid-CoA ligase [Capsaspora owczarzaki ATCC 30864]|uniref:Long-chain-fatty-acid-CoA ligase n=1 Tax=Capsaspora owczarzaki (strain ATCC 30864) TaxID=595528 RepID=A0A0D2VFY4_CAPO3|nr:long-chain-fatty-acid-CoA ligase [Capsaspora owczarzaki ATCC 30864]KJE88677.1 long-chain-fatty-acid-CoA ligase [Capsaspora owczarzaki ATCC 30864]|eukprot:XP_004365155.1 long-chain-fatty-acid-CoA ligase [Capsaspora owczarzaki ATCC 30864]